MSLLEDLTTLLLQDPRLTGDGQLLKNQITELALKLDPGLLRLVLPHPQMKEHFFTEVDSVLVFDKERFIRFVNSKAFLPDSYTSFKNKIGLMTADGRYLSESRDVVLAWPYKDCVLEGGQTQEDQKRDEIFWNEVLAPDEIDRLLAPKALTHWRRYDADGGHPVAEFSDGDNWIIKGNNLLVLHSLERHYARRVKLIYIDPPYNIGRSFGYNDRFKHSTWLTFMRDRLEAGGRLLRDDGVMFVSINHVELGYLLVLMDQIFGRENKLPLVTLRAGTTASYRSINECPVNVTEYVVGYKMSERFTANPIYKAADYTEDYSHFIRNMEDQPSKWHLESISGIIHRQNGCQDWREFRQKFGVNWKKKRFEQKADLAFEHRDAVVSLNTLQKPSKSIAATIQKSRQVRDRVFEHKRPGASSIYCYNGRTLAFFSSKFREVDGELVPSEIQTNLWTDVSFLGIGPEGNVDLPGGKKPELLMKKLIELSAGEPDDIVLDFHLGTGTTCAVAHKMGHRYVGIEQLDYGENDSVVRLRNVINGDPTGVSRAVGWKGGGSFVYCELMQWNERFVHRILAAPDKATLHTIWDEMREKAHLSYRLDVQQLDEHAAEFADLSLEDKRRFLMEVLDKNLLYVPLSEMNDETYGVSDEDKRLNRLFYGV